MIPVIVANCSKNSRENGLCDSPLDRITWNGEDGGKNAERISETSDRDAGHADGVARKASGINRIGKIAGPR